MTAQSIEGLGIVNHVFVVSDEERRWVVRFARDRRGEAVFEKEAWSLVRAAQCGVPSPEVLGEGSLDGTPYLIQSFVKGRNGFEVRSRELWRTLGGYLARVHAIPVPPDAPLALFQRFSRDPAESWRMHIEYNLGQLLPEDPLIELGVYDAEQLPAIRATLERLREKRMSFGLNYGDASLRNLIVPEDGPPVLIDWGSAAAGPVPYGDLVTLYGQNQEENDPNSEEFEAFAEGYGVTLSEHLPTVEEILLLNRLDLVRWAIDRRPDRLDEIVASSRAYISVNVDWL